MKKPFLVWGLIGLIAFIAVVAAIFIIGPEEKQTVDRSTSYNGIEIIPDLNKDGIPPLTNPDYESSQSNLPWLDDQDRVIGVNINGDIRAYPLKIMSFHEIVNDTIGGENVVVTYCPLCASSVMYSRDIDGQTLEFGNTGALYESGTVMYDTETNSYWFQVTGQSIRGEFIDQKLEVMPSVVTSWIEWRRAYPETQVLSVNTGYSRNYLEDPYETYYEPGTIVAFPPSHQDDRLPEKELIVGVEVDGQYKAYRVSDAKDKTIQDTFNNQEIEVDGNKNGDAAQVFFVNGSTRIPAPVATTFWFAWATNHPETELYQ